MATNRTSAIRELSITELHRPSDRDPFTDEDGMLVVRGRLTPGAGAELLRALDAAGEKLHEARRGAQHAGGDESTAEQRQADVLGLVAESALGGGLDPGTRGDRYQGVVHVDAEALPAGSERGGSALEDGQHVSAETSRGSPATRRRWR